MEQKNKDAKIRMKTKCLDLNQRILIEDLNKPDYTQMSESSSFDSL